MTVLLDVGLALESSPIELEILYLGDYCPLYLEPADGSTRHGPMEGAERGTYTIHEGVHPGLQVAGKV